MDILSYKVYIFNLNAILTDSKKINNECCDVYKFKSGFCEFFNLLLSSEKKINIITEMPIDTITLKFPFLLQSSIIFSNEITRDSYIKVVNNYCVYNNDCSFCDIISFENSHSLLISRDIIYNRVVISDTAIGNFDIENIISDFNNVETFVYKKNFEYIPFYVSSKTKYRNKWNFLKKHFPILASWTEVDKSKDDLKILDKVNICNKIQEDINESFFGILYLEKDDTNHIGSLIEMGMLIGQTKSIFLCGDNIFADEVLFNFKTLINVSYINNFNLYEVLKYIQHDINPCYANFKNNLMNILSSHNA
jgi:hypothetical protein